MKDYPIIVREDNGLSIMCESVSDTEKLEKQICALPRMVALLKRIKSMNEDVSGHIWFPQEILDTVESILRDIGEVE